MGLSDMSACRKIKLDESGRVVGWVPMNTQPNYEDIFPDRDPIFEKMSHESNGNLRDEYNRPFWKLDIKKKKIGKEDDGSDIIEHTVDVYLDKVLPTAEEKEAKRIINVNQRIRDSIPDMLRRGLSYEEMKVEAQKIDGEIK